ncbi:MAG TPA: VOC family protein [Solirubrobacteraceae bacterium]|nr:VOC family protein [Solirubrobacteraceae bacterium]
MKLDGLHHITMITGDARRNVDFYAELLGLRLVKKTVNFDAPDAYHLYFGDETGAAGSLLTWFEFPGAARGRAGDGMIHTIALGIPSPASLDFWSDRLRSAGRDAEEHEDALRFADDDGLAFELIIAGRENPPLIAEHPEIPAEHAIVGPQAARAYGSHPGGGAGLLTVTLGFTELAGGRYELIGDHRRFAWSYDPPPAEPGRQGAGTVHHIAWAARDEDHLEWQRRAREAGATVTDVRDRDYFRSVYFREPRGVLFEIATLSPGFAVDEDPQHLGEALRLPAMHEHLRPQLERTLTPIVNPRAARRESIGAERG